MHLEHVLGKINPDRDNLHVDGSLNVIRLSRSPYGTSMPGAGAVHHIRFGLMQCGNMRGYSITSFARAKPPRRGGENQPLTSGIAPIDVVRTLVDSCQRPQAGRRRGPSASGVAKMSVFGSIMSSIFGGAAAASPAPTSAAPPSPAEASSPSARSTHASPSTGAQAAVEPPGGAASSPATQVDIAAVMDKFAEASPEDLDWRKSIVDLMKVLKLDSSLAARTELAKELHYTGSMKDSAAMNVWLHKQVMIKLAENGGKVPSELKH